MPTWLRDLLFESPIPPSSWMPSRAERLADARITLRRRFGKAGGTPAPPAHRLRDLGSAHPLASGTRYISGESIEADLEEDITTINPPIVQGWAYLAFVLASAMLLVGMASLRTGEPLPVAIVKLAAGPVLWVLVVAAWGFSQRSIVLTDGGVHVRRWTDTWLGREGIRIGDPALLRARLAAGPAVVIEGSRPPCRVSMLAWGSSASDDVVDELPAWGIDCDFGRHRGHRRHH
jgi:hypothetical protein